MVCKATRHPGEFVSVRGIAQLWTSNGGSSTNLVAAVAVAWAESSGDRYALSPACALGLWQILDIHAAEYGVSVDGLYDVRLNAGIAVALSGDGTNWEAWDVAYAAGEGLTTRYYLP